MTVGSRTAASIHEARRRLPIALGDCQLAFSLAIQWRTSNRQLPMFDSSVCRLLHRYRETAGPQSGPNDVQLVILVTKTNGSGHERICTLVERRT